MRYKSITKTQMISENGALKHLVYGAICNIFGYMFKCFNDNFMNKCIPFYLKRGHLKNNVCGQLVGL